MVCFPCILYMQHTHTHEYKTCQEANSTEPNKAGRTRKFLIDSNQQEFDRCTLAKEEWLNWSYTILSDTKPCSLCKTSLSQPDHYPFSLFLNQCSYFYWGTGHRVLEHWVPVFDSLVNWWVHTGDMSYPLSYSLIWQLFIESLLYASIYYELVLKIQ